MNSETKICQNCQNSFVIEPDDFSFYEKIGVPAPTFCPGCRFQRRLAWRNERNLYKRKCDMCTKDLISLYSADKPYPAYCKECYWGDGWDAFSFSEEYDWSKPFFKQFRELLEKVPRQNLMLAGMINNCNYCNYFADGKDCYLCFGSIEVENCLYGSPYESKYCVDVHIARECEYCYECIDCEKLSRSTFCQDCANSLELIYCFDCKNCTDCIGCVGLRNQKYNIFNKQYSKEDYIRERDRLLTLGHLGFEEIKRGFEDLKLKIPHRYSTILQSVDSTGDHIVQSKNSKHCFNVKKCQDSSYCMQLIDGKNMYDANYCEFPELCYEYLGFWKMARTMFSNTCGESNDIIYSDTCSGSSNLFGCIGLRKKQYCILNKQYTKEEYEVLIPKIINHMNDTPYTDKKGRVYKYGEFFPIELSPLLYNETVAQEYFPLTEEKASSSGYVWKEKESRNYKVDIKTEDLPEKIQEVSDDIVGNVIECAHKGACNEQCTEAFKIIPEEFQFYKRMNLPLPKLCSNCRHYQRLKKRNPIKLWHRTCMCDKQSHSHEGKCAVEFETSYAPDRPEIVYCEKCYQQEVM
jgi:hypothetical protein